jgi:hypothetical protein
LTVSNIRQAQEERLRNLHFLSTPSLWEHWPFLPLVRRKPGQEEEYGVLYDQLTVAGRTGHSSTVSFTNLFLMPPTEEEFLQLPKEVYDSPEEVYAAGWRVD